MTLNDLLQWGAVAIVLIIAIVWLIRRVLDRGKASPQQECGDCPLISSCKTSSRKKCR